MWQTHKLYTLFSHVCYMKRLANSLVLASFELLLAAFDLRLDQWFVCAENT